MTRRLALLLAVLLLSASVAAAAPTRERTPAALAVEQMLLQVQPLADAAAAAAWQTGVHELEEGAAPNPVLAEALLAQAMRDYLLVFPAVDIAVTLTKEQASQAAAQLLAAPGPYDFPNPLVASPDPAAGTLRFDLSDAADFVGAYIYDAEVSEDGLMLFADLYRVNGIRAQAQDAPEDGLAWLGSVTMGFAAAADAPAGFKLKSLSVGALYAQAGFVDYATDERYELRAPDFFIPRQADAEGMPIDLVSGDGLAALAVRFVPGSLEALERAWRAEQATAAVTLDADGRLRLAAPGLYRVAAHDPIGGEDGCLVLEMAYPEEKEQEFSLYWVFLNNSFVVYSDAVG